MEKSQFKVQKSNMILQNNQQTDVSTINLHPVYQQTQLSLPPAMLPDDHWNDIEIISFGLNDTKLLHADSIVFSDADSSIVHYAASNNYLELLKKLITTDKSEIDLLNQVC